MNTLIAWDYETERFSAGNLAPRIICGSMAFRDQSGQMQTAIGCDADPASLDYIADTVINPAYLKAAHNPAYDLAVLCSNRPDLIPRVFEMVSNGEVHCTIIREKLLNLTDHGSLEFMQLPGGATVKILYGLAEMAKFHLGKDRTYEKEDEGAWRTNYNVLSGVPLDQWPVEAVEYVRSDSTDVLEIFEIQEQRREDVWRRSGHDPFAVQHFKVAVDFVLYLVSCWGMVVDPHRKALIEAELNAELSSDKLSLLYEHGIVRPATPPRPYANGAKNEDGTPKMTMGSKESVNKGKLKAYMKNFAKQWPHVKIWRTPKSDTFPEGDVSTKAEWFDEYASLDPVLEQYQHRQKLQKMVTTEMPRLCTKDEKGKSTGITSPIVHPCFNVLVETGRTSSFGTESYPSLNGQNMAPRARPCIVPRPGYVIASIDYNQMELGTLAQRCLDVLGHSTLAETINAGVDVHEYTGAQLAYHLSPEFQGFANQSTQAQTPKEIWQVFHEAAKTPESKAFCKHFRTFAKPTNLGYPGGLGPETFIAYAKGTFGITVDLQLATRLRELWMLTLPEMPDYFRWIKEQCIDHRNGPKIKIDDEGREIRQDLFAYTTRFGLHRAGATFCAAANGAGLQSPSAEGATLALFNVQRACFDPEMGSILYGTSDCGPVVRVINFIHDELLCEVKWDEQTTPRVNEIARIMVEAMRQVTPDVTPRATACLMNRWYKEAEPVFDGNGNLLPWEPTEN